MEYGHIPDRSLRLDSGSSRFPGYQPTKVLSCIPTQSIDIGEEWMFHHPCPISENYTSRAKDLLSYSSIPRHFSASDVENLLQLCQSGMQSEAEKQCLAGHAGFVKPLYSLHRDEGIPSAGMIASYCLRAQWDGYDLIVLSQPFISAIRRPMCCRSNPQFLCNRI